MKTFIFLDVQTEEIRATVFSAAKAMWNSFEIIPCYDSFIQTFRSRGRQNHDINDSFTCFITEKKTLQDADVVYGLYCGRLPVLSLAEKNNISIPLLETISSLGINETGDFLQTKISALKSFFSFHSEKSKVTVFEGGDGVGKATQTKLLIDHLKAQGHHVATLEFPSERNRYGGLLREVLSGKKGSIQELDPKLFSLLFSLNRFACLPELRYWVYRGTKIILDRYYTANCGHQASKLPEEERVEFIYHLQSMEISWLQLPPADIVLYLDLPPQVALTAMKGDNCRGPLDIHETAKSTYKESVRQTYLWCCRQLPNWFCIECADSKGSRLTREETHDVIYNTIKGKII